MFIDIERWNGEMSRALRRVAELVEAPVNDPIHLHAVPASVLCYIQRRDTEARLAQDSIRALQSAVVREQGNTTFWRDRVKELEMFYGVGEDDDKRPLGWDEGGET